MDFGSLYLQGILVVFAFMTLLWVISVPLKNVSIVDPFWSINFLLAFISFHAVRPNSSYTNLLLLLVLLWSLRLFIYLYNRNKGKGEDYRYQNFRQNYGPKRYWWFSLFQVFWLQGFLACIIMIPLCSAFFKEQSFSIINYVGIVVWLIGFIFESVSDYQLSRFKKRNTQKGVVYNKGLWKYSRHPNYFGNACIWWGFGLIGLSVDYWWVIISPIIMTLLLLKVSGVSLLERDLKKNKAGYSDYISKTSSFFPLPPKK